MLDPRTIESRTLKIEKMLNAPRELVWEAWTQPEHISNWWGPDGMETEVIHPTKEYRDKQEKMGVMNGWGGTFDRLYRYLDTLQ